MDRETKDSVIQSRLVRKKKSEGFITAFLISFSDNFKYHSKIVRENEKKDII